MISEKQSYFLFYFALYFPSHFPSYFLSYSLSHFPLYFPLIFPLTPLHYSTLLFFALLCASNTTPLPLIFPLTSFLLPSTFSSFLDCIQESKWSGYSDLCHNNSNFGNCTFTLAS